MAQTHDHTTQSICPACNFGPFTRNNYFTGKLLVERDFTDETRFHMEKLRHHEQQLHGWGVVCGLKVKPHPNPACQDRFVCIEPGSAVDCCGHDIIVREEECFDFTQTPPLKRFRRKSDDRPSYKLQICVRFRECPTEEIPVLYDDCGCDDTRCAPNRILESYELDVMVNPPEAPDSPYWPKLAWKENVTLLANVSRVASHDPSHRFYMLVGDDVYQVDMTTHKVGPNGQLAATGLEIAISNNGDYLFIVTEPASGSEDKQLVVLQTSNMTPLYSPFDLPETDGSNVRLVVASDNRLMVLVGTPGNVLISAEADLTGTAAPSLPTPVHLNGLNLQGLAIASDAQHAYVVGPTSSKIHVLNATGVGSPGPDIDILPTTANPIGIAVAQSTGPDLLAIIDEDKEKAVPG